MSESFGPHSLRARPKCRAAQVCGVVALALAGCGSTAHTTSTSQPPTATTRPIASAPPVTAGARRHKPARSNPSKPAPIASVPCSAGEKRTLTGLCYSPAAQTRLVEKLGPCPAGQVVADNGACQPLTARGPTNHPHSSIQGARPVAPGPGLDPVFH